MGRLGASGFSENSRAKDSMFGAILCICVRVLGSGRLVNSVFSDDLTSSGARAGSFAIGPFEMRIAG